MGINLVSPNFAAVLIHLWLPWPTLIELSKWTQAYLRCRPQKNWCCNCITSGSLTWLWYTFHIGIDSLIYGDLPDLNMVIFHTLNTCFMVQADQRGRAGSTFCVSWAELHLTNMVRAKGTTRRCFTRSVPWGCWAKLQDILRIIQVVCWHMPWSRAHF